ncbi:D-amino-acid transaminase [Rhodoblastus acidophilus]|uniref:Probable branched-chain-amino-acid aminotransferase n=1 Tax=Candidatus Rhodoblastus alkanivorans TaxID=2954117 RepID=A0ABS9Z6J6_9HYPH|nr:D-amino-acid transaminase [Candidatus Rhodoblastus alkanivorans]MCI4679684.1 D-amino-acid transaminase [Candidatus Rhodoblastus alkanivorans]MCI4683254.1 D-amino-acid transaminase [Candidatus Rhodoblastus alkanivorans]MDI4640566.1 D-amino-acid transaminase [Rhodoblastus acidophilus]
MSRVAYVNGRYIRHAAAGVSIDDRAFLFADGIYEVIEVFDGRLIDEEGHLLRLARSAAQLRLTLPMAATALRRILRELVARNRVTDGHVYLQVTRGAAKRDHGFPKPGTPSTVVAFAHRGDRAAAEARAHAGIKVISLPDIRWKRPDIKTTSLLPNVLAKQQAKEAGAYEAWLVDADGFVTEGSSSNAWIVDSAGVLVTHPADSAILAGITRARLLKIAAARGLKIVERPFTLAEAFRAQEAFISGATTIVLPVVAIDGQNIGSGAPGAVALGLRASFHEFAPATA